MKLLKKIKKTNILFFIMGAILFGGIGTVVATNMASSEVLYTTEENADVATIEDALDDLYYTVIDMKAENDDLSTELNALNVQYNQCENQITVNRYYIESIQSSNFVYKYWNNNFNYNQSFYTLETLPSTTYNTREALASGYSSFEDRPVYIKSAVKDDIIIFNQVCLWYNNNEFCLSPLYFDTDYNTTLAKITVEMQSALSATADYCDVGSLGAECYFPPYDVYCYSDVTWAGCSSRGHYCIIFSNGRTNCS